MKQTVVEWLQEQYNNKSEEIISFLTEDDFEQAKAMEKEQIMNAYSRGHIAALLNRLPHSEEYYHETFKSE